MRQTSSTDETIGKRLRRLRLERGLSQRELAGPGVSYAYISRIEGGQRRPSRRAIRELARRLDVSIEQLETGRRVSASEEREHRITDAELQLRLDDDLPSAKNTFRSLVGDEETESEIAARALAGLGLIAARLGDRREAAALLDEAIATGHLAPHIRPDVYEELAHACSFIGESTRAIEVLESALKEALAHAPGNTTLEVRLVAYLGCAYADGVDASRAKRLLHKAEKNIEALVSPQARVRVYWALARLAWWNEMDPDRALRYARHALSIYQATEDTRGLALAHVLYAQILNLERRWQEAARHLARADAMLTASGMSGSKELGVLRAEQAKCSAWAGRGDDALRLANEAEKLLGDEPLQQALKWHAYAAAHAARKDPKKAEPFFRRALDFLAEHRQWRAAALVASEWATLCRSLGETDKALDLLERASSFSFLTPRPEHTRLAIQGPPRRAPGAMA